MRIVLCENKEVLGRKAAATGAACIRRALAERGQAVVVFATGKSQFQMLDSLVREQEVDWSRVIGFHLDEYVGLADTHPASFRRYLRERLVWHLPPLAAFHWIDGDTPDPLQEVARLNARIAEQQVDVAFAGVGENGHLAFNDPPADFETEAGFILVELDEQCRSQQLGEGWFATIDSVPRTAISMTVRQIMRAGQLVLSVPDARKAAAVRNALEGPATNVCPASILQQHPNCDVFLDSHSASLLSRETLTWASR